MQGTYDSGPVEHCVLIETLWNVNEEDSLRFYYLGNSFNRNIFGM